MSDKSAEEMVGVKSAEAWFNTLPKAVGWYSLFKLIEVDMIEEIQLDAYRAGLVRASDHFLACLERLPRRPFASDWTDAVTEVRIAAGKVGEV